MRRGGLRLTRRSARGPQRWGTGTVIAGAAVVLAAYVLLLGRGAAWLDGSSLRGLTPQQRASEIDAMRGFLIQAGAGMLAFGALVYTALNFRLSREGHVTDRYTKAIEQLGSQSPEVRLGAIYALERIMIDSARDHPTIVEVLAAYVRQHAPLTARNEPGRFGEDNRNLRRPDTDVQASLTVLGRRPAGRPERGAINLNETCLAGAVLEGARLTGAQLFGTDLTHSVLSGADLYGANLNRANLAGAWLMKANLGGTAMNNVDLTGAILADANLAGAGLYGADFTGAQLPGANLSGSDMSEEQRAAALDFSGGVA